VALAFVRQRAMSAAPPSNSRSVQSLASGIDYLGLEIPRPLNVLFIENEGPREPFRRKLERKRATWAHGIAGAIYVETAKSRFYSVIRLQGPTLWSRWTCFFAHRM
jgi:hypothetical protein